MRRRFPTALLPAIVVPALVGLVAGAPRDARGEAPGSERPPSGSTGPFGGIGAYLAQLVEQKRHPGASVLVRRNGQVVYFSAAGMRDLDSGVPVERDTIFRIYSMTKPVTTAAIMILVDEGKIRLDDPVVKYVPEFSNLRVFVGQKGDEIETEPARPMTIENLLTHTSGLTYFFQRGTPVSALYAKTALGSDGWRFDPSFGGADGLARTLAAMPLAYQPGTRWHYSMSLDVAAIVVERAAGMPFEQFLRRRIFDPLGMADTGFSVPPDKAARFASLYGRGPDGELRLMDSASTSPVVRSVSVFSGGGGLVSTIDDYGRFAQMLADSGEFDGHRILSRRAVDAMMTNHLSPDQLQELPLLAILGLGGTGQGLGFGYGGAVVLDPRPLGNVGAVGEYSWGGAASTIFWVDRTNELVVVFMTQVLPPGPELIRDRLRSLTYEAIAQPQGR